MIPKSGVPEIAWPAVPTLPGALMLAIQQQFLESERLPKGDLEEKQFAALERVLRHAVKTVPYYRDRSPYTQLAPAGRVNAESWSRLPVLTRADIQDAGEAMASDAVPADHLPVSHLSTSGSTGRPLRALRTRLTNLLWLAVTLREQLWHRRDFSGRWAAVRTDHAGTIPPAGTSAPTWGPPADTVYETGPAVIMSVGTDIAAQARWLVAADPDYLMSLPSNLVALAGHFLDTGAKLPRLRQVCTYGETVSPELGPLCQEAWGAGVVDVYSAQELGYIALQCPDGTGYHVQSEVVYVEVLNEQSEPCSAGDVGRVVVSTLHNYAMPFLRYETGDYAEVGEPCPCGRTLPVLNRVLGRSRNMLTLPDGRRVWPTFGKTWKELTGIRQFQLVQDELDHIQARLVTRQRLTAAEESRFGSILAERFGYPFRVSFTYLESIDRSRERKFEDFVSLVPPPAASSMGA